MEPAFDIGSEMGYGMGVEPVPPPAVVADDDAVRAHTYSLLAALLASPPRQELFDLLSGIDVPSAATDDGLGTAWRVLKLAGGACRRRSHRRRIPRSLHRHQPR